MKEFEVGQEVFSAQKGAVVIDLVVPGSDYPVMIDSISHTACGRYFKRDKHPTLFHSKQDFLDYWTKQEEPPKKKKVKVKAWIETESQMLIWTNDVDTINVTEFKRVPEEDKEIEYVDCSHTELDSK